MRNSKTTTFSYTTIIHAPQVEVWDFFSVPTNLTKLTFFPKVAIFSLPETKVGNEIVMKLSILGLSITWVALIEYVEPPHTFVDRGVRLPFLFKDWRHEHSFLEKGTNTVMIDTVDCQSFLPPFLMKVILKRMFQSREKRLSMLFSP